jgi:type IV pilus assembly protein PilB
MGTVAKRIGELLVEAGVLSQSQLEQALFAQRKDGRKLGQLLVEIAEKYSLVPIFVRRVRKQGETLYVAMDDPTNDAAIEEVARAAGLPVKPMIASPSDIRAAIRVYYLGEAASPPAAAAGNDAPPSSASPGPAVVATAPSVAPKPAPDSQTSKPPVPRDDSRPRRDAVLEAVPKASQATHGDRPSREVPPAKAPVSERTPPGRDPVETSGDSADAAPEIEATEREVTAPPKRHRARMISLTLLDGTTIAVPAPGSKPKPDPDQPREDAVSDQLTARDLVSALRAVAHGADASEILGTEPRWEAMFSALLSILLRKGLIADWEFLEEFRKI